MEALQKINYNISRDTNSGLRALYQYWLKNNNCRQMLSILNRFSRLDAVLQSGDTTVVVEYKRRSCSIAKYRDGFMFEREKFESMRKASELFEAPSIYIMDFVDAAVIHQVRDVSNYQWSKQLLPSDQHKNILVDKEVAIVPFDQCDYIIGKRTWERASYQQLLKYFRKIDNEV